MIIRAKAPLRLGLAGGGTDVSPYCDIYGGAVLNACINMFAYATIEPRNDGKIELICQDRHDYKIYTRLDELNLNGEMDLLKGVYNVLVSNYTHIPHGFTLSTYVDAPAGSGLGSSSTLVVAIVKAFQEWLNLPLGEYDLAEVSWNIERKYLNMPGGRQDQYAAAFGGFNFMEFNGSKVLVNPLKIRPDYINELEFSLILYYMGTNRFSAEIIESQVANAKNNNKTAIQAMHKLKEQAYNLKQALLSGKLDEIGPILNDGWENKKKMSVLISNPKIDSIYKCAINAGATGGKISGAGGGGFFVFYCPKNSRYNVIKELKRNFGGEFRRFRFSKIGAESWRI